ncbi:hypothetical protein SEA_SLIMJIMMY_76 [Mycobacterium phage SlimJimmy]|nr:hypothetical protein SEA_SLIMJIMMY_76 [Mycobacterium phage SlimJimmy]
MSTGEVVHTSATGGQKAGNRVRMSLVPGRELLDVAELYGKGAEKYSAWNWAKGYDWSLSFDALNRHLWAWWDGEEFDNGEGGTGLEHLTAVVFHALALMYFRKHFPELDDRPNTVLARNAEAEKPEMANEVSFPLRMERLTPEWTRAFTWYWAGTQYKWLDGDRGPGWYFHSGSQWVWSSENLESGQGLGSNVIYSRRARDDV